VSQSIIAIILTVAVAGLSWKYFESPILRLRDWPWRHRLKANSQGGMPELLVGNGQ
jgi:peptidoglycan/LPS O-acetylase OafA/YrhL